MKNIWQQINNKNYVVMLCTCGVLFVIRVVAQIVQLFFDLEFLPPFEAWHSGALAYPWLLVSQAMIIIAMAWVITRIAMGRTAVRPILGAWLLALGGIYFLVMLFRLIAGFTFAADHPWFGARLPAFFHIVLSVFVLLVGHYHYRATRR